MANTIRASKNTFNGGLVMDLAPDTTPNEVLTSALNATLVTFNGNELLLQNDMGNGRVETARLPEGYIPVGTCEFGDIIYIVSYNPLTNRSQIGCFPSPERLISSEETGSMGLALSAGDFLELDNLGNPTGNLVSNSVKKIIYNNELNPGDKFIIYDKNNQILSEHNISDMGNTSHVYGSFPKYLKIHVVAIEDSGKINYLDSTLRWYEYSGSDYFLMSTKGSAGEATPDIDSYRNKLSSGYSVFQSKISGKLALLIELEKITGFSCTHTIFSKEDSNYTTISVDNNAILYKGTTYTTYINFSWETENNDINPKALVLTGSSWKGRDSLKPGIVLFWKYDNGDLKLGESENQGNSENIQYVGYNTDRFNVIKYNDDPIHVFPEEDYWETLIDNPLDDVASDNPFSNLPYSVFLTKNYLSKLKEFISSLDENYSQTSLSKLNIDRQDTGEPILKHYYINAVEKLTQVDSQTGISSSTIYSKSSTNGKLFRINSIEIPDYITNNYFKYPVYKKFLSFYLPTLLKVTVAQNLEKVVKPDISNMVYQYEITPAMPYGLLKEYAVTNYIDFSKLGSGEINLRAWKYFVGENVLTLTTAFDAYVEENMGISEIAIEFYDNLGVAAVYHIANKASYSGQFTETIPLNGVTAKYNLNSVNGDTTYYHCGTTIDTYSNNCAMFLKEGNDSKPVKGKYFEGLQENYICNDLGVQYYMNDCGTLYQGMLYLAKIIVKYCPIDVLENFDDSNTSNFRIFYRWIWTTTMYNDYYYQVDDFNDLKFNLTLDANLKYLTTDDYYFSTFQYNTTQDRALTYPDNIYKYLSAGVQVITDKNEIDVNYIENNNNSGGGSTPGGNTSGDNNNQEEEPLWSNWQVRYSNLELQVSISCTNEIENFNRNMIVISQGNRTLEPNVDYIISLGGTEITIAFMSSRINQTELIVITTLSNWAWSTYNGNPSYAPNRPLEFMYNPNG